MKRHFSLQMVHIMAHMLTASALCIVITIQNRIT